MILAINPGPEGEAQLFKAAHNPANNGSASASSSVAASSAASSSVDATITQGQSVWTTTYTNYDAPNTG
ncbi:hypothetical protein PTI98_010557 [Pleurotus ostreatus]|nr:hypothetical protein PTI98_010557 [Pleurotus ostreatus]